MKGQTTNCKECNRIFVKKKNVHTFCRTACRVASHRHKKGIAAPAFMGNTKRVFTNAAPAPAPTPEQSQRDLVKQYTPQTIKYSMPVDELQMAIKQRDYWMKVYNDAREGVFPIGLIGGMAAGSGFAIDSQTKTVCKTVKGEQKCTTKKNPNGVSTFIGFGIGALVGYALDEARKKNTLETAAANFNHYKGEIVRLQRLGKTIQSMVGKNELSKRKNTVSIPQNHPEIVSSAYYRKQAVKSLKFDGKWKYLVGQPSENFFAMVYGVRGNGKSTFCIQFADYLDRNFGKAIYLSSEQPGINQALQNLTREFNTKFDLHTRANKISIEETIEAIKGYSVVIVDSINHIKWSANDLERIREKCPKTAFICIFQATKEGNFKGSEDFAHNCDIIVECKKMVAHQTKSRFAQSAYIPIRDEADIYDFK